MSKANLTLLNGKNDPRIYDVLRKPIVTEKATNIAQHNYYAFVVGDRFSKKDVKLAVESIYKVTVEDVNVLNVKGKVKRFKGRVGKRSDYKKAYVKLLKGQTIDLGLGV